jgi:hypothetical protein
LERKRIHTEVSTRTIIRSRDWLPRPAHVAGESRERVAQIHEAPVAARTRHVERAPPDQDEPCRYLSLHRRLTWRCATAGRRYGGSSSYIRLCHRCMAVVAAQRGTRIMIKRVFKRSGSSRPARSRRATAVLRPSFRRSEERARVQPANNFLAIHRASIARCGPSTSDPATAPSNSTTRARAVAFASFTPAAVVHSRKRSVNHAR